MRARRIPSASVDRRRPRSLYRVGVEPDARFTLANERTFLAWIRTSLAFLASGVALDVLGLDLQPQLRMVASLTLIGAGVVTPGWAWYSWMRVERAMRRRAPLPGSHFGFVLVGVVGLSGLIVVFAVGIR